MVRLFSCAVLICLALAAFGQEAAEAPAPADNPELDAAKKVREAVQALETLKDTEKRSEGEALPVDSPVKSEAPIQTQPPPPSEATEAPLEQEPLMEHALEPLDAATSTEGWGPAGQPSEPSANETAAATWGASDSETPAQTAAGGSEASWETMSPYVRGGAQAIVEASPGHVTNFFYETSLREALTEMGIQSGVTIIPDNTVQGLVTVDLKNVPVEQALDIVLSVGDFTWRKMDGFILVGSMDPESPSFNKLAEIRTVRLNHTTAKIAAEMLPETLRRYVTAEPEGNALLITAPVKRIEEIERVLRGLDTAPRQLVLEARVVVMETVDVLDMGIQWDYPSIEAGAFSDNTLHGRAKPPLSPEWPWGIRIGYTPGQEFTNALLLTLNLLAGNDQATVIASPQVMALDGQEAEISVTSEEYFEILTQAVFTRSELERIEAGTVLRVTPRIAANGDITLQMSNEVSDVVARGQGGLPVVTRRVASSTVRVRDGGTVVVAGLTDNRTRYSGQKVPGAGSIPLLGNPFRNDATQNSTKQLFVFLTPRLLDDHADDEALTEARETLPLVDEEEFRRELEESLARLGGTRE